MKYFRWSVYFALFFLAGCGSLAEREVIVIDGDTSITLTTSETLPILILSEAGIMPQPIDRVLVNGVPQGLEEEIKADGKIHLELRRAVKVNIVTPDGEQEVMSSALTIGDLLEEEGVEIGEDDEIQPPRDWVLTESLVILITPARELTVSTGGESISIRSTARTVGEALAGAAIPLMGLDTSIPAESEALPLDGQIQVTRVSESVLVEYESIPFSTEETYSEDVPFGEQEVRQIGINGVMVIRTRVRFENGVETSREVEGKSTLREPVTQIVVSGSKITLAPVGGNAPYQYWYATEMYATWYSPCNSGISGCAYGTSSGAPAGFGIVAVDYSIYSYLAGMRVYIPGYGLATIGDTGGGPIVETNYGVARTQWIDLGYDDNNIGGLSGWVTVYFLEPAPAEIPYFFR